jgi:isocitrate dehydrogenase (NAD+)
VGTAGSANLGDKYAMFEAIHGSAPRMIERGMGDYANPASMIKAGAMLLRHICRGEAAAKLEKAMDECDVVVKSDGSGATAVQYTDALIKLL